MLAWKGNIDPDSRLNENVSIVVKSGEGVINSCEVISGDAVTAKEVTNVHECGQSFDHVGR
jgi:hypothetical protein